MRLDPLRSFWIHQNSIHAFDSIHRTFIFVRSFPLSAQFPNLIFFLYSNFRFILKSLFKPISDYLLKPFLVSLHNWLCVPLCGLSHHGCILCTHTISPCFRMVAVTCCSSRKYGAEKLEMSSPLPY